MIPSVLDVEALGFADRAGLGRGPGWRRGCGDFGTAAGARLGNLLDEDPAAFDADDPMATVRPRLKDATVG